jgi:hypothetical protein
MNELVKLTLMSFITAAPIRITDKFYERTEVVLKGIGRVLW